MWFGISVSQDQSTEIWAEFHWLSSYNSQFIPQSMNQSIKTVSNLSWSNFASTQGCGRAGWMQLLVGNLTQLMSTPIFWAYCYRIAFPFTQLTVSYFLGLWLWSQLKVAYYTSLFFVKFDVLKSLVLVANCLHILSTARSTLRAKRQHSWGEEQYFFFTYSIFGIGSLFLEKRLNGGPIWIVFCIEELS